MRSRRPIVAMNVRWLFTLFLLTALFYLQDAASEDSRDGRILRLADGPDEVHTAALGKMELRKTHNRR